MPLPIEDYAVVSDRRTAAVIGRDGSVDWWCLPRFDAPSCFTALLGGDARWALAPAHRFTAAGRRYRTGTMVLETDLATDTGTIRITDCMPIGDAPQLLRTVTSLTGTVVMSSTFLPAFGTGSRAHLWRSSSDGVCALSGPDGLLLDGDVQHHVVHGHAQADFTLREGDTAVLRAGYVGWHAPPPFAGSVWAADQVTRTADWWQQWIAGSRYRGPHRELVERSLLVLQALTHRDTGGIAAAATSSLPERLGGRRNWDYRYCWLRDATFTLLALVESGFLDDARAWREWLVRAVAGCPTRLQVLYGLGGESALSERTIDLPGYGGARPVRLGNGASGQQQLDVYGEVIDFLHHARVSGLGAAEDGADLQRGLLDVLEGSWQQPDRGIWEVRGTPQHFVFSKVMAWVGVDRVIKGAERAGASRGVLHWIGVRDQIRQEVLERGWNEQRGSFVQAYGSRHLDAALLRLPGVGFVSGRDPRMLRTINAVQRELIEQGFVHRYLQLDDGLPSGEGCFLPCTYWLAEAQALAGRPAQARETFLRAVGGGNDLGLFSEEYDPGSGRMLGNLPQAMTHVAVINTAFLLAGGGAARTRSGR